MQPAFFVLRIKYISRLSVCQPPFLFSEFGIFGGCTVHTTPCTQATMKGGVVMQNRENNRGNQNQQTRENSQSQRENRNQDQKENRK